MEGFPTQAAATGAVIGFTALLHLRVFSTLVRAPVVTRTEEIRQTLSAVN